MITINNLTAHLKGGLYLADNQMITSLEYDSRTCQKGSAFFCFPGNHTNGEEHISNAIENGAVLIVLSTLPDEPAKGVSYFVSDVPIRTLYAKASSWFYDRIWEKMKLIGVTGTDGKSSTCDFIYQLLCARGIKCGLLTTVYKDSGFGKMASPYRQSTPEAFALHSFLNECYLNKCTHVVIECTSHALSKEYNRLADIHFSASLYTEISSEHLEFHKTLDAYYKAKSNLARYTTGVVLAYKDSKAIDYIRKAAQNRLVTLDKPKADTQSEDGIEYTFEGISYKLPFFQGYMLENAFEAANLVSRITKVPLELVLRDAEKLKGIRGRGERINNNIARNLIIDFAHTPDSFHFLFEEYRKLYKDGAFIALFGAAGSRDKSKREGLGREASRYCRTLIITEEDPREESCHQIAEEILAGISEERRRFLRIYEIENREEAIAKALELSNPGDTVFFLGKGHENSIEKNGSKREYSEYKAVLQALETHSCGCRI